MHGQEVNIDFWVVKNLDPGHERMYRVNGSDLPLYIPINEVSYQLGMYGNYRNLKYRNSVYVVPVVIHVLGGLLKDVCPRQYSVTIC